MVMLDDAGMVNLLMGKEWQQFDAPAGAAQVLLSDRQLWCRTKRGEVFRLSPGANAKWVSCDLEPVSAMSLTSDGAICVLLADHKLADHNFLVRQNSVWEEPAELPTLTARRTKGNAKSPSTRSKVNRFFGALVPRFSLRNLLLFVLFFAVLMGPILSFRKGMLQDTAAAKLMSSGELVYAYQLDDDGNLLPSPVEPGATWLKQWLPRHCFLTPVRYTGSQLELLSEFDSISEVTVNASCDLNDLKKVKSLRRLKLVKIWDPRAEMPQLPQVKTLEIDGTGEFNDLRDAPATGQNLNFLKGWSGLRSLTFSGFSFGFYWKSDFLKDVPDLRELAFRGDDGNYNRTEIAYLESLRHLERLEVNLDTNSFDVIADMQTLKVLDLDGGNYHQRDLEQLAKLTQLETLILHRCAANYVSLDWVKQFPKLQHLSIESLDLQDISALGGMPNLRSLELLDEGEDEVLTREQLQTLIDLGIKKIKVAGNQLSVANELALRLDRKKLSPAELVQDMYPNERLDLDLDDWQDVQPLSGEERRRCLRDIGWLADENFLLLQELSLPAEVQDFSPIKGLDQLIELRVEGLAFDDLSLLAKMSQLESLSIERTGVTDLKKLPLPIVGQLRVIDLSKTKVTSVAAMKSAQMMEWCIFDDTAVKEIPIFESDSLRCFDANKTLLTDLSPLTNSLVELIRVNHSPVNVLPENLSELDKLEASYTKISDLRAVKTYPKLEELKLNGSLVTDAGQLNHHPSIRLLDLSDCKLEVLPSHLRLLTDLTLANTSLPNLAGLKDLPRLNWLDLRRSNVEDISELANFKQLKVLKLAGTKVTDLSPLAGLNLGYLDLSDTQVTDLSPLAGNTNLSNLQLSGSSVTDLTGLPENDYSSVDLSNTQITDLSPLSNSSKLTLNLSGTPIEDLSSLELDKSVERLDDLNLSDTRFSDLSVLSGQSSLGVLNLARTQVRDLSPLAKLARLYELDLSGSSVDLSTIRSLYKYQYLRLHLLDLEIHDLSPLKHLLELGELHIDCTHLKDLSELAEFKGCKRLGLQNVQPHHDFSFLKEMPRLMELTLYDTEMDTDTLQGIPESLRMFLRGFPLRRN